MGELDERRWAVVSERGREAVSLTYMEARELERSLAGEKIRGLCIVTDEAASHLHPAKKEGDGPDRAGDGTGTGRRAAPRGSTA
jgi:hypothetical protein